MDEPTTLDNEKPNQNAHERFGKKTVLKSRAIYEHGSTEIGTRRKGKPEKLTRNSR